MREENGNVNTRVMYNILLKGPVKLRAHVSAYQRNEDLSHEHGFANAFFLSYFGIYREYISYYDKSFREVVCYSKSFFITSKIFMKCIYIASKKNK